MTVGENLPENLDYLELDNDTIDNTKVQYMKK
jgi:hypothetical protein